jgi:hypothetical protein
MKKILLVALLTFSTSAFSIEFVNAYGVLVSNRCNGFDGSWWIYPMSWAIPVGMACHTQPGVPGVAGG